jgi:hypothetical protein
MKKMQRNKATRAASVLMIIAMILTVALSGTLAKYTASATANSQWARVAAFRVLLNGRDILDYDGTGFTLDLFSQADILCHNMDGAAGSQWMVLESGHAIAPPAGEGIHVTNIYQHTGITGAPGTPNAIIAPGMGGYANLTLQNLSEVPIHVRLTQGDSTMTLTKPANLRFYASTTAIADNAAYAALTDDQFGNTLGAAFGAVPAVLPANSTATTVSIAWRWIYSNTAGAPAEVDCGPDACGECIESCSAAPVQPDCGDGTCEFCVECGYDVLADCEYEPCGMCAETCFYVPIASGTNDVRDTIEGTAVADFFGAYNAAANNGAGAGEFVGTPGTTMYGFDLGSLAIRVDQVD